MWLLHLTNTLQSYSLINSSSCIKAKTFPQISTGKTCSTCGRCGSSPLTCGKMFTLPFHFLFMRPCLLFSGMRNEMQAGWLMRGDSPRFSNGLHKNSGKGSMWCHHFTPDCLGSCTSRPNRSEPSETYKWQKNNKKNTYIYMYIIDKWKMKYLYLLWCFLSHLIYSTAICKLMQTIRLSCASSTWLPCTLSKVLLDQVFCSYEGNWTQIIEFLRCCYFKGG